MRTRNYFKGFAVVALMSVLVVGTAWSQRQGGRNIQGKMGAHQAGLNLSEEQKEQMKTFRLELMKEMTPLKNEIQVKSAELKAASTGDKVDTKKVNSLLDAIGDLKTEMAKRQFAHKQKVRNILNDEQKVLFDAHAGKMFGKKGKHGKGQMMKQRMHKGNRPAMKKESGQYRSDCPVEENTEILG